MILGVSLLCTSVWMSMSTMPGVCARSTGRGVSSGTVL